MDEAGQAIELVVGQLDKRMAFIEQNLVEIRGDLEQIRAVMPQIRSELTAEMRTTVRGMITTMIALFGTAGPVWTRGLAALLALLTTCPPFGPPPRM